MLQYNSMPVALRTSVATQAHLPAKSYQKFLEANTRTLAPRNVNSIHLASHLCSLRGCLLQDQQHSRLWPHNKPGRQLMSSGSRHKTLLPSSIYYHAPLARHCRNTQSTTAMLHRLRGPCLACSMHRHKLATSNETRTGALAGWRQHARAQPKRFSLLCSPSVKYHVHAWSQSTTNAQALVSQSNAHAHCMLIPGSFQALV